MTNETKSAAIPEKVNIKIHHCDENWIREFTVKATIPTDTVTTIGDFGPFISIFKIRDFVRENTSFADNKNHRIAIEIAE